MVDSHFSQLAIFTRSRNIVSRSACRVVSLAIVAPEAGVDHIEMPGRIHGTEILLYPLPDLRPDLVAT
jgi:hypothetical protein